MHVSVHAINNATTYPPNNAATYERGRHERVRNKMKFGHPPQVYQHVATTEATAMFKSLLFFCKIVSMLSFDAFAGSCLW